MALGEEVVRENQALQLQVTLLIYTRSAVIKSVRDLILSSMSEKPPLKRHPLHRSHNLIDMEEQPSFYPSTSHSQAEDNPTGIPLPS